MFDPRETSYAALCEVFWRRIDPTLRNQVGLDRGASYRHALYAHGAEQLAQATASLLTLTLALILTLTLTLALALTLALTIILTSNLIQTRTRCPVAFSPSCWHASASLCSSASVVSL